MKYYKSLVGTLVVILVFLLGIYVGERDYSDFNFDWYRDANATKLELVDNMGASLELFYEFVYDREEDSGKYDELIDSLEAHGLAELRYNIDSIYADENGCIHNEQ